MTVTIQDHNDSCKIVFEVIIQDKEKAVLLYDLLVSLHGLLKQGENKT